MAVGDENESMSPSQKRLVFRISANGGILYGHHIQQNMDQPGKVANPARGQLNRENEYSPVPVRA